MKKWKEIYESFIIREYLLNDGDGGEIMECWDWFGCGENNEEMISRGYAERVDIDDYWYVVNFIDDYCGDLIKEFQTFDISMDQCCVDEYEIKIHKRLKEQFKTI